MRMRHLMAALLATALFVPALCACDTSDVDAGISMAYDGQYDSHEFSITLPEETGEYTYTQTGVSFQDENIYAFFSGYSTNDHTDTTTHLKIYDVNGFERDIEISYPGDDRDDHIYKTYGIIPNDDGLTATAYLEVKPVNAPVYNIYTSTIDLMTGEGSELLRVEEIDGTRQYVSSVRRVGDYICIDYGEIAGNSDDYDMAPSYLFYKDGVLVSTFKASDHPECSSAYCLDSMSYSDGIIVMKFYTTTGFLSFEYDPVEDTCVNFEKYSENLDKMNCCMQYANYLPDYGNSDYDNIHILSDTEDMVVFLLKNGGRKTGEQRTVMVLQKTSGNPNIK